MKWSYRIRVRAGMEHIYENVVAPDRWMSFYLPWLYRGPEAVTGNWPEAGSAIVVRYGLGPLNLRLRQNVVSHERGRRIRIHEEVWGAPWIDDLELGMTEVPDGTDVILTTDQTSRLTILKPLALLRWLLNWLDIPPAARRFKAMVESESRESAARITTE